jgi:hypothetical protein
MPLRDQLRDPLGAQNDDVEGLALGHAGADIERAAEACRDLMSACTREARQELDERLLDGIRCDQRDVGHELLESAT